MSTSSTPSLALTGLASGLDTGSIVSELMQVNSLPEVALKNQQTQVQARQAALTSIETELQNLKDAADALSDPSLFGETQTVDSSDSTKITATRVSGAGTGGTQLVVSRLASSQTRTYGYTPNASDTVLDLGSGAPKLTIPAGSSIDNVVSSINSASGLPVYAASISDPNDPTGTNKLLVLSSKQPGSGGDFSLASDSTAGLSEIASDAKAHAASGASQSFDYTADPANPTTININGTDVAVDPNTSIDDLITDINNTAGVGAQASKDSNGKLVLTSSTLGASSSLSVTGTQLSNPSAVTAGQDSTLTNLNAAYSVDGGPTRYATSNTVTDAIPGLSLTFKSTNVDPVTIIVGSPAADENAISSKVQDFVDQYNTVMDDLNTKLTEQPVANASGSDLTKGLFFGDPLLENIQDGLRNMVGSPIGSNPSMNLLSEIGLSTGATTGDGTIDQDSVDGKLTLDTDTLTSALENNPDQVKSLLGASIGGNGFGQAFDALMSPELDPGGDFDSQQTQSGDELSELANQISDMDENLQETQQRLQAQFTAMETALSASQSQQQWLTGEISSLAAND
ncbi:MAG TPA: flagellar filament capping protein FliD [Thermoleophilaceae bacterium]